MTKQRGTKCNIDLSKSNNYFTNVYLVCFLVKPQGEDTFLLMQPIVPSSSFHDFWAILQVASIVEVEEK